MSAPLEYYRKVVEITLLRQIVACGRGLKNPLAADNSDLEVASLATLNSKYEGLMDIVCEGLDWLPPDDADAANSDPVDIEPIQRSLDLVLSRDHGDVGAFFISRRGAKADCVALFERVSSEEPNVRTLGDFLTAHDRMVHDFLSNCGCGPEEQVQFELFELNLLPVSES